MVDNDGYGNRGRDDYGDRDHNDQGGDNDG